MDSAQPSVSGKNVEEIAEPESHFVLRLPLDLAKIVRHWLSENDDDLSFKNRLQIKFDQDMRNAQVKVDGHLLNGKLMDLPCIIETYKTLDRKNFFKTADCPQILTCHSVGDYHDQNAKNKSTITFDDVLQSNSKNQKLGSGFQQKTALENSGRLSSIEDEKKKEKQYQFPHGITNPLKNVRKRRFRKTLRKKYMDAPELEKELKRLLRTDLEAESVRWELITPEQEDQKRRPKTDVADCGAEEKSASVEDKSLNALREDELFGGAVSSTSSEDEEEKS